MGEAGGGPVWLPFCEISWVFPRALSRCGPWLSVRRLAAGGTSQAPGPREAEGTTGFDRRGGLGLHRVSPRMKPGCPLPEHVPCQALHHQLIDSPYTWWALLPTAFADKETNTQR